jgi:catabolite repression HPr-like protein
MITKNITVNMKAGATPVAMVVQVASRYESSIYITEEDKKINAKSIMGMMALGLANGTNLSVAAEGKDECEAVDAIESFLRGTLERP